jgi:nitrate/nitrite-specific signal transduction histidine kinase
MNGDDRKGRSITAEEFFDHCLVLAGVSIDSQQEAEALRDEVRRVLGKIDSTHIDEIKRIESLLNTVRQQGENLQKMYAPELVKTAAEGAKGAVRDFRTGTEQLFESMQGKAEGVILTFWTRTLGAALVGVAVVVMLFGIFWWYVPPIDELKARRTEFEQLNSSINMLAGAVDFDGGKWVRADKTQRLCKKGGDSCADYVRVK